MVGYFKERIAGAFEHIEPWFISSVAFDPKKCQVDIHIDVRKTTDIVCPYYRRATPYYVYEPHRNLIATVENAHNNNVISRFDYVSDAIGRRTTITRSGSAFSSLSGSVPLRGDAKRDAVVTVNGDRAERDNGTASFTPWSYALPSSNSNASFQHADILAVAQSATGEDGEQRESGLVFVPASQTLPTYDDDGNMTFDGRFRYSWNGENRMIRTEETVFPTNRAPTIITYAYDHQGRMVSKIIAGTNSVAPSLIWDGYNIVRETDNGTSTYNIWGLDLDGTLQGCGGVGGLLAVCKPNGLHLAFYDANGNISEYVSQSGSISAHYEYSPFGAPLISQDLSFTHQFSTKPYYQNFDACEYLFRQYSPTIGRWLNRDHIFEQGGFNVVCACCNNLVQNLDLFGLEWTIIRNGGSSAHAIGRNASIEELANVIGLPVGWWQEWLSSDEKGLPYSPYARYECLDLYIPNTIIAYWAGDAGRLGRWWVNWNEGIAYLKKLGFKVDEYKQDSTTPAFKLKSILLEKAQEKELHGLYFWGHGWSPYPSNGLTDSNGALIVNYYDITLPYPMALAIIFACDSNSGMNVLASQSPNSITLGFSGTLYPFSPWDYVSDVIKPSDQGTNGED